MNDDIKIEHTVKVEADGCCCPHSWCHFFFSSKDKSSMSHPITPVLRPDKVTQQPPHLDLEVPRK